MASVLALGNDAPDRDAQPAEGVATALALESDEPDGDAQPAEGINAALGSAFSTGGKPNMATAPEENDTADALFCLLFCEDYEGAAKMVKRSRDLVNEEVAAGHSVLHEGGLCGGPRMVEFLLNHGASVEAKDSNGNTPDKACVHADTRLMFETFSVVYNSKTVAPELDGKVPATCQVCFATGCLGLGPGDFCLLPCGHTVHKPCMKQHVKTMLKDKKRLLQNLSCQHVDMTVAIPTKCNHDLNKYEHMRIYRHILDRTDLEQVQNYLVQDAPGVALCPNCGDAVAMSLNQSDVVFRNLLCKCKHEFCGRCINGPHPGMDCREAARAAEMRPSRAVADRNKLFVNLFKQGLVKPCPLKCVHMGHGKDDACDHATCQCGHEYCWDCGVDRRVFLAHDNRWHKPSCRYYTDPKFVNEAPKRKAACPKCQATPGDGACAFTENDGWPETYLPPVHAPSSPPRQSQASSTGLTERAMDNLPMEPKIMAARMVEKLRELVWQVEADPILLVLLVLLFAVLFAPVARGA